MQIGICEGMGYSDALKRGNLLFLTARQEKMNLERKTGT